MSDSFIEFGERFGSQKPSTLKLRATVETYHAVEAHPQFKLLELRQVTENDCYSEILVVDCKNDQVPSKNRIGIKYCERLALRFWSSPDKAPEVRALRRNFPVTPHQNHVQDQEPASLCLYLGPWSITERSWTPQKHLNQILLWLADTASGSLHKEDQPVEQLYFQSKYEVVLPPDFDEKVNDKSWSLIVEPRPFREKEGRIMVGLFIPAKMAKKKDFPFSCIALSLPPIVHGPVERFPISLGGLHNQLMARGVQLSPLLFEKIQDIAEGSGLPKKEDSFTLLILRIPIIRSEGSVPEKYETIGFTIRSDLGEFGVACGLLHYDCESKRYWKFAKIGESQTDNSGWGHLPIDPVSVIPSFSKKLARVANGIPALGPKGILVGVGALGSSVAAIWFREGWGGWTPVDHDYLKPHNLARHTSFEQHVGSYKVDIIKQMERSLYPNEEITGEAIAEKADNFENQALVNTLESAELIVDATATVEFARDLSTRDHVRRATSIFLTPSGNGSALLIENAARSVRLDALEAQYYRAIINLPWGSDHLSGNRGHLWVGAGCRDISTIIPYELIQLHASILARHVRLKSEQPDAVIQIWHCNPENGEVSTDTVIPAQSLIENIPSQSSLKKIIWDEGLRAKIRQIRADRLPKETGGILLGYIDQKLNNIYVVDALPAPADSQGDQSGFTRGTEGLQEAIQKAQKRTAEIVSYIGEWHSHPQNTSSLPSTADLYLLRHLSKALQDNGQPAIMLIVGEQEERWLLGEMLVKLNRHD